MGDPGKGRSELSIKRDPVSARTRQVVRLMGLTLHDPREGAIILPTRSGDDGLNRVSPPSSPLTTLRELSKLNFVGLLGFGLVTFVDINVIFI